MPAGIDTAIQDNVLLVTATGSWTVRTAAKIQKEIDRVAVESAQRAAIDLSGLDLVDTAGALLIKRLRDRLTRQGRPVALAGLQEKHAALIERVMLASTIEPLPTEEKRPFLDWVDRLGLASYEAYGEAIDLLYFLGVTTVSACRSIRRPSRIRIISVISHIESVGFNALPIVGLLSFLIGIVVAYQGADQLRRFGAEIFTVNLLGDLLVENTA